MSRSSSKTLIRSAASSYAYLSSAARPRGIRRLSTLPESLCVEPSGAEVEPDSEAKAVAVEKIEDLIHGFIVRRSKPDWIPFLPGASYWVPPRSTMYGVAGMVENLANALTEEEYLSLTTLQGWPSSAFYIHNDVLLVLDKAMMNLSEWNARLRLDASPIHLDHSIGHSVGQSESEISAPTTLLHDEEC